MKVGKSGYFNFDKIGLKHWREMASMCGFTNEDFEKMRAEIKAKYLKLEFTQKELPKDFNQETLELILEGMKKRANVLLV